MLVKVTFLLQGTGYTGKSSLFLRQGTGYTGKSRLLQETGYTD